MNGEFKIKTLTGIITIVLFLGGAVAYAAVADYKLNINSAETAELRAEFTDYKEATTRSLATIESAATSIEISMNYMKEDMEEMKVDFKSHLMRGDT